jgi:hypothetical protein
VKVVKPPSLRAEIAEELEAARRDFAASKR